MLETVINVPGNNSHAPIHWTGSMNSRQWEANQTIAQDIIHMYPIGKAQPNDDILQQLMPNAEFLPRSNPSLYVNGFNKTGDERMQIEFMVENFDLVSLDTMRRSSDGALGQGMYFGFAHWQHAVIAYIHLNLNSISSITRGEDGCTRVIEAKFINGPNIQRYPGTGKTRGSLRFRSAGNLNHYEGRP